jgi:cell division protein FtsB
MRAVLGVLTGLLVLVQYQLWLSDGGIPEVLRLREAVSEQRAENERLRQRNEALAANVRDLKNGLRAVEERARGELGMIGEQEVFYQVVGD